MILNYENISETISQKLMADSPFFGKVNAYQLTQSEWENWLQNILFFIEHTPIHLRMALERAEELRDENLINFFQEKIAEEDSHDQWARDDLQKFGQSRDCDYAKLNAGCYRVLALAKDFIRSDLKSFVVYILFFEYLSNRFGADFLQSLKKCGINLSAASVLSKHVVADEGHVEDDFDALSAMSMSESEFLYAFKKSAEAYSEMLALCLVDATSYQGVITDVAKESTTLA